MPQAPGNANIHQPSSGGLNVLPSDPLRSNVDIQPPQWAFPPFEGPETGRSGGSNEDLLDFTQSDMGWDFDFSTMDMEAFFSVYPPADNSMS